MEDQKSQPVENNSNPVESLTHTITETDIQNNPELADHDVRPGDTVEIGPIVNSETEQNISETPVLSEEPLKTEGTKSYESIPPMYEDRSVEQYRQKKADEEAARLQRAEAQNNKGEGEKTSN